MPGPRRQSAEGGTETRDKQLGSLNAPGRSGRLRRVPKQNLPIFCQFSLCALFGEKVNQRLQMKGFQCELNPPESGSVLMW